MFKKKWVWVVAVFLVINIVGLVNIISLLERGQGRTPGIVSFFNNSIRHIPWLFKKAAKDISANISESIGFKVKGITPSMSGVTPSIEVSLTQDVDLDKIGGYIEVTPKIDFYVESFYGDLRINGNFLPRQKYTVEILKGMPSENNEILESSVKEEITIPDYEPYFKFKIPGIYMALKGNQLIPLEAINVDKLKIKVHRIYDNNIVYLLNNRGNYALPSDMGIDVAEKEIATKCEINKTKELYIDLKETLSGSSRGLFFVTLWNPDSDSYWGGDSRLILTSDIGIVAKKSDSDLFVWLNSLSGASSIMGAKVKVFSKTNQQLLEGVTDANGVAHFKNVDWKEENKPFVISAVTDNDLSFIELEKCTLSETGFNVTGRPYLSKGYEAYLYTDRGIFRPGETVKLRSIVRDSATDIPESFPVIAEIIRPDKKEYKKINGILSRFGTADFELALPDYALTGMYTANLKLPGAKEILGSVTFNVEEFMPDRLKVTVSAADKRFNISETIPISIKAEHFFGAPASERVVEIRADLRPIEFKPDGFKDYSFTDTTRKFVRKPIILPEKKSDENGQAVFDLKLPEGLLPSSAIECGIGVTVKETGGRAVSSYAERTVDAYPYYIGIRQAKEGYAAPNEKVKFDYVVVSPSGNKIEPLELEMSVCKIVWSTILKKDAKGEYRFISEDKEETILKETVYSTNAAGELSFTPNDSGEYIIRIKGKNAQAHTASLKFYSSEAGYMPWAMERPDRIELSLDKKVYQAGEQAKLLIKSPFLGKALITISKDKVLQAQTVDITTPIQEITLDVTDDFSPNAYCAITIIRPVTPEEKWSAHRAYGIIPLVIDNASHKLSITLNAPGKASPKDKVRIDASVVTAQGAPQEAELSIALVDEGITRLTNFKTPDPFEFFYGRRANFIQTADLYSFLIPDFDKEKIGADSTPSADGNPYDPKDRLNPVSAQRVKPVVLWKASLVTDKDGKASAEFDVPEFIGNLKVMVVGASAKEFGNAHGDIKVTEPLMITPNLPRVISTGDDFIVPVIILNDMGSDQTATVSIEVSSGFTVVGESSYSVEAKDKKESSVIFNLKAAEKPQKGTIIIKASASNYSTSRTTELAIRPPAPLTTLSGSGVLKAPGSLTIKAPAEWLKGTEKYSLVVSALPGVEFLGALKFLMQYPYGCIEQTTSSVYPLLYLKDVAAKTDPQKFSSEIIDNYINAGIEKILSMQTSTGGFSLWPGYYSPDKFGSVYAADFLVDAEKAGYNVPKLDKDAALDYLEMILPWEEKDSPLELKAYVCYVLSKAGRPKQSWVRKLQERKKDLPEYARFYLAAALMTMNDKHGVSEILGVGLADKIIERNTGDDLNSYVKTNSLALSMYMDIDPENPIVPTLVKRLKGAMKNGSWGTTQDNAAALLGLGKYIRYLNTQDTDYQGSIVLDKNIVAQFDSTKTVEFKNIDFGAKDLELSAQGKGNIYYYWSSVGVPLSGKIEEKDKGIKIRRSLLTREGKDISLDKIVQGEIIVVDLTIQADVAYKNVIVEDLLPACFEIENPRIATSEKVDWMTKDNFAPDQIDVRDDRLLLFTDLPSIQIIHYRYVVRAVTKGKFALPAISASCMYDPSIASASGQGNIEVK